MTTATDDPRPTGPAEGRHADGRFAPGNKGGPGNPFARQTAALRKEITDFMAEGNLRPLVVRLHRDALEGDNTAARLLLQYALGRPAPVVDPDELDIHEMHLHARAVARPPDAEAMNSDKIGAKALNEIVRVVRPTADAIHLARQQQVLVEGLDALDRADERKRRRRERRARAKAAQQGGKSSPAPRPMGLDEVCAALQHPSLHDHNWVARPAEGGPDASQPDAHSKAGPDSKRPHVARAANGPANGRPGEGH